MESSSKTRAQEGGMKNKNPSPIPSQHNNNETNNNRGGIGIGIGIGIGVVQIQTSSSSSTPGVIPSPRSDSTTFVQADTSNFKQVVQMLTGSSETTAKQTIGSSSSSSPSPSTKLDHHHHRNFPIPPIKTFPPKRQQQQGGTNNSFRLYERRNLMINTLLPGFNNNTNTHRLVPGFSPKGGGGGGGGAEILSPSMLNFPRLNLSPVTPLADEDAASPSLGSSSNSSLEEERAIAEKGFYLHPSPRSNTPRDGGGPPQLLPLFPLTSPRASESTS